MDSPASPSSSPQIDQTTILSLLSTVLILLTAYLASRTFLPPRTASTRTRILFVWHAFDALIHFCLEGSFLYNCFFVSAALPVSSSSSSSSLSFADLAPLHFTPPGHFFLADSARAYGARHGVGPLSRLWQEYGKADRRWAGADLTVVSLEILTVGVGTWIAVAVCWLLVVRGREREREVMKGGEGREKGGDVSGRAWFWMVVLATGELYGGYMTFAPEWLSGSPNLDTSNWLYLWVYLVFFNGLWVVIPIWILWEAYGEIVSGLDYSSIAGRGNIKKD